jgi:TolB-like protein
LDLLDRASPIASWLILELQPACLSFESGLTAEQSDSCGDVFKEVDVREIGARLNVENILEGSVRKAGNRIRVTAQIVSAADGCHHWS